MAHFRGTLQSNRGAASRLGSKDDGLSTSCRGWKIGVDCFAHFNTETQRDEITVQIDGGSGPRVQTRHLGTFYRKGDKFVKVGS